jgi:peptidoglycan/LPS O-acetylase OafA/YrhL
MPAYWACLLVTAFVLAPLLALLGGRPVPAVFTGADGAVGYVTRNAFLHIGQYGIEGLPLTPYAPGVLNGSLWTLFFEGLCYLMVGGLGLAGILRRRPGLVAALAGALWLMITAQGLGLGTGGSDLLTIFPRLALLFLLGSLGLLLGRRVPIHDGLAAAAGAVLVGSCLLFDDYRSVGSVALAYLCLWATVRLPGRSPGRDLSYGAYLWHWPVIQLIATLGLTGTGQLVFVPVATALTLLVAWGSWTWIEAPALRLKGIGGRPLGGERPISRPPAPRAVSPHSAAIPLSAGEAGDDQIRGQLRSLSLITATGTGQVRPNAGSS